MNDTIKKILENKSILHTIKVEGTCYKVDYVEVDMCGNFEYIATYIIDENDLFVGYDFYEEDLQGKEVKLYKLQEI